ncbi:MAG: diguanylate cyclase [Clostridiales bacterium]|nr:diguanylate cyclase [Clostridiales bacterium]
MEKAKTILVVDDSKANLTLAKQALDEFYQVSLVTSGQMALRFLEKRIPDLILMDINMPEMDGLETLRQIRANNEYNEVPVIFLTARNDPETEVECLKLGAADFIGKPFVPQVMRSRIARTLELEEFRRLAEKRAKRFESIASKDPMTGLWNRTYMTQKIEVSLAKGTNAAYMIVDVDHFKSVNDKLGHIVGDQVLNRLAHMMIDAFPDDIVGRLGGDEFVIFIEEPPEHDVLCERIREFQTSVNEDLKEATNGIATLSIGIALAPQDGNNMDTLYDKADRALYVVKKEGRNSFRFYDSTLPSKQAKLDRPDAIEMNIRTLMQQLKEPGTIRGAYWQDYEPFLAIFRFIERMLARSEQSFCVMLATLLDVDGNMVEAKILEPCMDTLFTAIQDTLRKGDVFTKFSSAQYVIMLPSANAESGGKIAAERLEARFNAINREPNVELKTDLTMMDMVERA